MGERNPPSWQDRADGSVWISHMQLAAADLDRLSDVRNLTLWAVKFPEGALGRLHQLEFLDMRGGSGSDLTEVSRCERLRGLVVNQVRGLSDASGVSGLASLELLELYGLARLEALPDFSRLVRLRRVRLGQLRALAEWTPLLQLRALEELVLSNKVYPDKRVFEELGRRRHLKKFDWSAPDEPSGRVEEITRLVGRPRPMAQRPEDWFAANASRA